MSGYFDQHSMVWRIHRERAVGLAGPRALLMQAAHPRSHAYRVRMLEGDQLLVNDWARGQAREIVLEPPVPW